MSREHLVTKVNNRDFILQCRRCIGVSRSKDPIAPHQGYCVACNTNGVMSDPIRPRTTARQEQAEREKNGGVDPSIRVEPSLLNNPDNVMFRCTRCYRTWHAAHLAKLSSAEGAGNEEEESADIDELFRQYTKQWTCRDCRDVPGEIETLVAWRPVNRDSDMSELSSDMIDESAKEFLVKWKKLSYSRVTWMPGSWVWGTTSPVTRKAFHKSEKASQPRMTTEDAIPEDFYRVDIIFDVHYSDGVSEGNTYQSEMACIKDVQEIYVKYKGLSYEDAVWEAPPNTNEAERYNDFHSAYADWVLGHYVHVPKKALLEKRLKQMRRMNFNKLERKKQPSTLTGGELMGYQMEGLNWLYYKWFKGQNAILADEMGLGKTIQVIAFFATLIQDYGCYPFLIVAPHSTCTNWRREIKMWVPSLRVVTYYGSSAARQIAQDYEMFTDNNADLHCHIVVTSYESMNDAKVKRTLAGVPWAGLVADEGQRLKNDKSMIYNTMSAIHFPFKVLLTGTPLQNNIRELFNILQFLDPSHDAESLEKQYAELTNDGVAELHEMIRPSFLRRTKAQVLRFLPPLAQIIIPVSMSTVQKKLYKSILAKNPQLISAIFQRSEDKVLSGSERYNLNNILMQLRKCLCHPFIYSQEIEERTHDSVLLHRNLVEASSKLKFLELLLPKLKERGHRVLIFSQFLSNIDVIEDFLDGMSLLHRRLDGSMSSLERQKQIDEYNAPGSPYFAFLLSTRAGGVGINLASADTVIIMDPDFNPHQDMQAASRAHRIGQQKKVLVFKLMTRPSVEEKIMQIGQKKMMLDHVLIERMDADDDAGVDLEAILRHGAQELFDDDTKGDIQYDNESIELLLDRSKIEAPAPGNEKPGDYNFSQARVWVNDSNSLEEIGDSTSATPDSDIWEKILQERERAAEEAAKASAEVLGRGKRKRQTINYGLDDVGERPRQGSASSKSKSKGSKGKGKGKFRSNDDSDGEFQAGGSDSTDANDATEDPYAHQDTPKQDIAPAHPSKRSRMPSQTPVSINIDPTAIATTLTSGGNPCPACSRLHPRGLCSLKTAPVEHCSLCGLAHYGLGRTCLHLSSETHITMMLAALRESTEPRMLVDEARRYLHGVLRDLLGRKKRGRPKGRKNVAGEQRQEHRMQGQWQVLVQRQQQGQRQQVQYQDQGIGVLLVESIEQQRWRRELNQKLVPKWHELCQKLEQTQSQVRWLISMLQEEANSYLAQMMAADLFSKQREAHALLAQLQQIQQILQSIPGTSDVNPGVPTPTPVSGPPTQVETRPLDLASAQMSVSTPAPIPAPSVPGPSSSFIPLQPPHQYESQILPQHLSSPHQHLQQPVLPPPSSYPPAQPNPVIQNPAQQNAVNLSPSSSQQFRQQPVIPISTPAPAPAPVPGSSHWSQDHAGSISRSEGDGNQHGTQSSLEKQKKEPKPNGDGDREAMSHISNESGDGNGNGNGKVDGQMGNEQSHGGMM